MLLTAMWRLIFSRRATIYQWFSGLFAEELSKTQFVAYQNGEANEWLAIFEQIDLGDELLRLRKAITEWQTKELEPIDLRADFTELFLLDQQTAAIPYASFYLEEGGQLYGEMEAKMRYFLAENHLQMHADFKEPADHVAVYLALMGAWSENAVNNQQNTAKNSQESQQVIYSVANEQHNFLQQAVLNWLPKFEQKTQRVAVDSDFYAALTTLLLAFIEADANYLQQLATQNGGENNTHNSGYKNNEAQR